MLRDLLHQLKDRATGHDESPGGRLDALAEDVRALEREVSGLRTEVQALRTALDALQHAAPAATASKRRGGKAAAAVPTTRLEIRSEDCIGCGTCVDIAPAAFAIGSDGRARVVSQDGPAEAIEEAIQACPTRCIVRVA